MSRKSPFVALALLGAAFLGGCAEAPAPSAHAADAKTEFVDRRAAIASAKRDASFQYGGEAWIARTDARQLGRFWVIELHAQNGSLVRYTIATRDGVIHERFVQQ